MVNVVVVIVVMLMGGVLIVVIGGVLCYLMVCISVLQQINQVYIIVSFKVVMFDNIEVIMDSKQNFYVLVVGYQLVDLYSILVGVLLCVLLMVVIDGGMLCIWMNIYIEDGQIISQMVGNLLVVNKSEIDIQVFINEGESLLIVGYLVDQQIKGVDVVFGFLKILLLGVLFWYDQMIGQWFQCLFLLILCVVVL